MHGTSFYMEPLTNLRPEVKEQKLFCAVHIRLKVALDTYRRSVLLLMCTAVHMRSCTEVQGPRMTCLLTAWRIELLPINVWWYLSPGDVLSDCKRSPHRQKEERSPLSSVHRVVITTFCQCSLQQVGDHTHMIRSYTLLSSDRACDVEIKNDRAQV